VARRLEVSPAVLRQLAVAKPRRYPALLESAVAGPLGKVTILAAQPRAALWSTADGRVHGQGVTPAGGTFLDALESWWRQNAAANAGQESALQIARHGGVPFAPGWVVFLGYEIAADIEPHLTLPRTPLPWTAFALRTPCALVHVLATDSVWAIAEPGAEGLLDEVIEDAQRLNGEAVTPVEPGGPAYEVNEEDPARYLERVLKAKEYIRAGDIYQANLSRPWRVRPRAPAGSAAHAAALDTGLLYERLRARNPAPFAALVQWDGVSVLSSSPEKMRPRRRRWWRTPRSARSTSCSSTWSATTWGGSARPVP
jgi:anthranilate synthase component 1